MKLARSTFYYRSRRQTAARRALERRIALLCAEFPRYGYRRITAELRTAGLTANHKAVARVMRERGLQVRPLRRFVRRALLLDRPLPAGLGEGPPVADQLRPGQQEQQPGREPSRGPGRRHRLADGEDR